MSNQAFFYVDGVPTKGIWLDLDLLDDFDEVLEALANDNLIGRNEDGEPEYGGDVLVSDIEGDLPSAFYSSRSDSFDLDGFVEARDECDDEGAAAAYIGWAGNWSKDGFENAYRGKADSETEYAEQYANESGLLGSLPENLLFYFDFEAFGRDLFINDFYLVDGFVFDRNC